MNSSERNPFQSPAQIPLQALPLKKRERGESKDVTTSGKETEDSVQKSKRSCYGPARNSTAALQPQYLIVHRVTCDCRESHIRHQRVAHYHDVPRLFAGDSKASALRGRRLISNIEEYLEDSANISIVVYKTYSCNNYHEVVKDQFERLQIPNIDREVISSLKSYFFSLKRDSEVAQSTSEEMAIVSGDLRNAMCMITETNPERMAGWEDPRNTKAPYLHLYHCRDLMDRAVVGLDGIYQQHIAVLLEYVNKAFGPEYHEADALFSQGFVTKKHFPKLFGPNEIVVTSLNDQPLGYVSKSCPEPSQLPLTLDCWSWNFDGIFRKERTPLSVDWPSSVSKTLPISSLQIYPLRFDASGLEERLRRRGEKFWRCRRRKFISYKSPNFSFEVRTSNPRYMIDLNTYQQMHSDKPQLPQHDDLGQDAMNNDDPPEGSFSLLIPANILGFGFHDKKWRSLSVEHIDDISWNMKAFDRLVLKPSKKELIKALVTVHIATSKSTDVIEGKGNGLIILLHGGPGTGKTLTAESVAELTNKPLYRVTCGDIGTNAEDVEKYLESVLCIGTIWGCVVLLDEADVFLEERTQTDLQRNALVSVFLRVLEYYEGILILTSNRVGTFDEAFKSRVQLALHYPSIDYDGRWEIWSNFINGLHEINADAKVDELKSKIDILARNNLNGREIRNIVKTAMQLAHYRNDRLEYSHFQRVIEVADEFEKYLVDTHGHDASEWAQAQKIRLE